MKLLLFLFLLVSSLGLAEPLEVDPNRTVDIQGVIDSNIEQSADKVLELSEKSSDPIYVIINSRGGNLDYGSTFVSAIKIAKSRGVNVKCVVTRRAYSMAMFIYGECSERYALPESSFMWHSARFPQLKTVDEKDALKYYEQLRDSNKELAKNLRSSLNMDEETYFYHNDAETYHSNSALKDLSPEFHTEISDIKGYSFRYNSKIPQLDNIKNILDRLFK